MQPKTIFNVKELCEKINTLKVQLYPNNIEGVILADNTILGISSEHHKRLPYEEQIINEPLFLNITAIEELQHTNKPYIGFEDGLHYEFYNSADELPNPCL